MTPIYGSYGDTIHTTDASVYATWQHMMQRCYNRNLKQYKDWGGRGITVYKEWRDSYAAFWRYVGKRPSPIHRLDRIDNNGNYEPGNLQWATPREQQLNRRNNVWLTIGNTQQLLMIAAEEAGVPYHTAYARYKVSGDNADKVLRPVKVRNGWVRQTTPIDNS